MKPRTITAKEKAKQLKLKVGPETTGKVLWYDQRDSVGLILSSDGRQYTFSLGRVGHIGVSAPNYVIDPAGKVSEGQSVKFKPVGALACDIRLAGNLANAVQR